MKQIKLNLTNEQISLLKNSILTLFQDLKYNEKYDVDNDIFIKDLLHQVYKSNDNIEYNFYEPWNKK